MCTDQTDLLTQRDLIEYSRLHKRKTMKYYSRMDEAPEDLANDFK